MKIKEKYGIVTLQNNKILSGVMCMSDIQTDYRKLERELHNIQLKIKELRKGNLRKKTIKGREYYYLQYREDGHIRSIYVRAELVEKVKGEIEERKEYEQAAREMKRRLEKYAALMGIHRTYRPVRNIDYGAYTLFMSKVAHDYKLLDKDSFIEKYKTSKYRGLEKRYLVGFFDYINGMDRHNMRRTNDLVLDPYTYMMYFKYGHKEALEEELKNAIPAFLNQGLLITNVQEAVDGTYDK